METSVKVYFSLIEAKHSRIKIQIKNWTRTHFVCFANSFEFNEIIFAAAFGGGMEIK